MIAARFTTLETQMQQGRDELARKLDEVKSTVEEVKRMVNPGGNAAQARYVMRNVALHVFSSQQQVVQSGISLQRQC